MFAAAANLRNQRTQACPEINARQRSGEQSCNQFISVIFDR
jgi:hypothetical protein